MVEAELAILDVCLAFRKDAASFIGFAVLYGEAIYEDRIGSKLQLEDSTSLVAVQNAGMGFKIP